MLSCFKVYSGGATGKVSYFASGKSVKTGVLMWVKTFQPRTMTTLEEPQRFYWYNEKVGMFWYFNIYFNERLKISYTTCI